MSASAGAAARPTWVILFVGRVPCCAKTIRFLAVDDDRPVGPLPFADDPQRDRAERGVGRRRDA